MQFFHTLYLSSGRKSTVKCPEQVIQTFVFSHTQRLGKPFIIHYQANLPDCHSTLDAVKKQRSKKGVFLFPEFSSCCAFLPGTVKSGSAGSGTDVKKTGCRVTSAFAFFFWASTKRKKERKKEITDTKSPERCNPSKTNQQISEVKFFSFPEFTWCPRFSSPPPSVTIECY